MANPRVIEVCAAENNTEIVTATTEETTFGNKVRSVTFVAVAGRNKIGDYVRVSVEYPD